MSGPKLSPLVLRYCSSACKGVGPPSPGGLEPRRGLLSGRSPAPHNLVSLRRGKARAGLWETGEPREEAWAEAAPEATWTRRLRARGAWTRDLERGLSALELRAARCSGWSSVRGEPGGVSAGCRLQSVFSRLAVCETTHSAKWKPRGARTRLGPCAGGR